MAVRKAESDNRKAQDASNGGARGLFAKLGGRNTGTKGVNPLARNDREAVLLLENYEESQLGWFWSTDTSGRLTYLTPHVAETIGLSAADATGLAFVDMFHNHGKGDDSQRTLPFILTRQSKFEALPLRAAVAGKEIWWSVSGKPCLDASGNFTGYRGSAVDITKQRQSAEDTSRLAMYDSLTGLCNRARMSRALDTTLAAFGAQKRVCALMLIDLDRFKAVNDTLGHQAGDELLKQVARRLMKVIPDKERVARIGGDEFQVMLPDIEDRGTLGQMAEQIISSLSQPYSISGSRCSIGASVGIAVSPFDGLTSEELIRNADLALYAAKGNGRGRFRFYSSELLQAAEDKRILEQDLRDAIPLGQISLAYQPIVDAITNKPTGCEALIRWTHPERGPISPALFIPIAEEANLIGELGEWALRKACEDAAQWPGKMRVAVNVSAIQFGNDNLPKIVRSALENSGLAPERLELEITEGVFLAGSAETDSMFKTMKQIGVRLALDDFGTGYSSLSYLQTAPFDKIKIDQSFVRNATLPESRNAAIISAIVALAKAVNMETTAEGIETLDQLELIRKLEVSHVQGYVYSKPVTNEDLLAHIEAGDWVITPSGPSKQRNDRQSTYRKVNAIHENHCYAVVMRNISSSGALIEGLVDVPIGTQFVIDFGDGQLAISTVRRSKQAQQGLEFEEKLVSDGNGGLCTRHRVSPYLIAAAGLPTAITPSANGMQPTGTFSQFPNSVGPAPQLSLPAFSMVSDWKS